MVESTCVEGENGFSWSESPDDGFEGKDAIGFPKMIADLSSRMTLSETKQDSHTLFLPAILSYSTSGETPGHRRG